MDVSVVIPTLKQPNELIVLDYLEQCDFDSYEVILRDDYPVTAARNRGYEAAATNKIIYLDDDSMPRPGYLREASLTLDTEAAVAGKTIHPRDDLFAGQLTSHYDFGSEPRHVNRFWGCNMAIRREVLEETGGWDETIGWGHEEKELAERVLVDHRIYYNPTMVVDHVYADSLRDYLQKQYKLERKTPYFLQQQGHTENEILRLLLTDLFDPSNYFGRSPSLMLARSARMIAATSGRLAGYFDLRSSRISNEIQS